MTTDLQQHYRAVLEDLASQRTKLFDELSEVESAMAAIQRRLAVASPRSESRVSPMPVQAREVREPQINYAGISVRWAVLALMAEVATGPMGSGAIAEALQARGVKKEATSPFVNIVSAVISNLRAKGEVETAGDGLYQLTDAGRAMWQHIKSGPKFREALSSSISPTLLDAR